MKATDTAPPEGLPLPSPSDWGVTSAEARGLLEQQLCPVCGEGPWKSPLNHVARKHGIDRHTMRDICDLTTTASVTAPDLHQNLSEQRAGLKPEAALAASKQSRRKYRMTRAGKAALTKNLASVTVEQSMAALRVAHGSEATAKRAATLRTKWESASDEERQAVANRLRRGREQLSAQANATWDRKGRKGCGSRASYRRGCRCEDCRAAYLAYRKTHG